MIMNVIFFSLLNAVITKFPRWRYVQCYDFVLVTLLVILVEKLFILRSLQGENVESVGEGDLVVDVGEIGQILIIAVFLFLEQQYTHW